MSETDPKFWLDVGQWLINLLLAYGIFFHRWQKRQDSEVDDLADRLNETRQKHGDRLTVLETLVGDGEINNLHGRIGKVREEVHQIAVTLSGVSEAVGGLKKQVGLLIKGHTTTEIKK